MHTSTEIFHKKNVETSVQLSEGKIFSYENEHEITSIKERWLYLKARDIINDLTQIKLFTQNAKKSGFRNIEVCQQIDKILSILQTGDRRFLLGDGVSKYVEVVRVITKYLNGIQRFLSNIDIKSFGGYTILFESTMIAIVRDVNYIVGEAY